MRDPKEKPLSEVDSALYGLLESLLSEVEDPVQAALAETASAAPAAVATEKIHHHVLKDSTNQPLESLESTALSEVRPAWGQDEFSALLFYIQGQALAIPVLDLAGVEPCPARITPIPGQPVWHMGVLQFRGGKMIAVDLSQVLGLQSVESAGKRGCYLLAVDGGHFGFRCDAVPEPLRIDPETVRWSKSGTEGGSGLLAGMLSKQMCPLLNVDHVLSQLKAAWAPKDTNKPDGFRLNSNSLLPKGVEKTT